MSVDKRDRMIRWVTLGVTVFYAGLFAYQPYENKQISLLIWIGATVGMFVALFFPLAWCLRRLSHLESQGKELHRIRKIVLNAFGMAIVGTGAVAWVACFPTIPRAMGLKPTTDWRGEKIFEKVFSWTWYHLALFLAGVAVMTLWQTWAGHRRARANVLWPMG